MSFPRREDLPAGIVIKPVSGLGTTWYERGARYWVRRVFYVLFMAFVLACESAALGGLFYAAYSDRIAFWVLTVIEAVWTVVVWVYFSAKLRQQRQTTSVSAPDPTASRRARTVGPVLGILARTGSVLAGAFLAIGALLTYGVILLIFARAFLPQLDAERLARAELVGELQERERATYVHENPAPESCEHAKQAREPPTPESYDKWVRKHERKHPTT
jgi:hypothetical protein